MSHQRQPLTLCLAAILQLGILSMTSRNSHADAPTTNDKAAADFVAEHLHLIRPLEYQTGLAWWNANVSGLDADFQAKEEAQNKLDAALSNPARFKTLDAIHKTPIGDPVLRRQIHVLYLQYLEKQVDADLLRKMASLANKVEKTFNTYRAKVNGKALADSEVRRLLKESHDSAERRNVWEASKGVGSLVEGDLKELVRLRNQAAKKLGFPNFQALQLHLNEQTQEQVLALFDELDSLTRKPFLQLKGEIDAKLAENCRIGVDELRPWHYQDPFFQESPAIYAVSFDPIYAKADILQLCRDFYNGIGLPIDDVIARSDLYEKAGKSPHAFCIDIDRQGDVRVLANIVPNEYWMGTMLHELGHSVYSSKNIPDALPYVIRTEAHILTTEGIAMLFERFSKDADWLQSMGIDVPDPKSFDEAGAAMRRAKLLIFSRWCQVMFRFEKGLYEDPDQDLNALWWNLVEKYQGLRRPEGRNAPDYASKIHVVTAPVYYHNYMMGELFAIQVFRAIARDALNGVAPDEANFVGKREVGDFLKQKVFGKGRLLPWNDLTKFATGEPLNARAFANEINGD
jgi:peptidyl-dipeptidase A